MNNKLSKMVSIIFLFSVIVCVLATIIEDKIGGKAVEIILNGKSYYYRFPNGKKIEIDNVPYYSNILLNKNEELIITDEQSWKICWIVGEIKSIANFVGSIIGFFLFMKIVWIPLIKSIFIKSSNISQP